MFERWIGRRAKKQPLSPQHIAGFEPFSASSPAELETVLGLVEHRQVPGGLLDASLSADRVLFLHKGTLQIQTRSGYLLVLEAGGPQAQFPLPAGGDVVSMYAAEPCSLLSLPPQALGRVEQAQQEDHAVPELTPEEAEALERLQSHLQSTHCELPSLPDLALKIGKVIDDPDTDNDDVARLIQHDPSLSTRILSVVNSAAFGGLSKISSVNQATARLGRERVRSLVYSCLLRSLFRINSGLLKRRMEDLWAHSAYVAALSFVLGRETPGIDPEQALLAGLIHDIGAVTAIGAIGQYPVLAQRPEVLDYAISNHRVDVGIKTLSQWHLSDDFREVVKDAENWHRLGTAIPHTADVVVLAQLHALIGTPRQAEVPRIDEVPAFAKLARGQLTPHHSLSVLEEAEADVRDIRTMIGAA